MTIEVRLRQSGDYAGKLPLCALTIVTSAAALADASRSAGRIRSDHPRLLTLSRNIGG